MSGRSVLTSQEPPKKQQILFVWKGRQCLKVGRYKENSDIQTQNVDSTFLTDNQFITISSIRHLD